MALENVVRLKPARKPTRKIAQARRITARTTRRLKLQHAVAVLIGVVAAAMTTVSLSHIAGGVAEITHGAGWRWDIDNERVYRDERSPEAVTYRMGRIIATEMRSLLANETEN